MPPHADDAVSTGFVYFTNNYHRHSYVCAICRREFPNIDSLQDDLRTHKMTSSKVTIPVRPLWFRSVGDDDRLDNSWLYVDMPLRDLLDHIQRAVKSGEGDLPAPGAVKSWEGDLPAPGAVESGEDDLPTTGSVKLEVYEEDEADDSCSYTMEESGAISSDDSLRGDGEPVSDKGDDPNDSQAGPNSQAPESRPGPSEMESGESVPATNSRPNRKCKSPAVVEPETTQETARKGKRGGNRQAASKRIALEEDISKVAPPDMEMSANDGLPTDNTPEKRTHKRVHQCKWCDYSTPSSSSLSRHERLKHTGLLNCDRCHRTFSCKYDRDCHIKSVHEGHVWSCQLCPKTFKSRCGLWTHKKTHELQHGYICEQCGVRILQRPHYIGHVNKHLNVKPHVCSKCSKGFTMRHNMLQHERTCVKIIND